MISTCLLRMKQQKMECSLFWNGQTAWTQLQKNIPAGVTTLRNTPQMGPRFSTSVICDHHTPVGTRGWVHMWHLVKTNTNSAAVWNMIRSDCFFFPVHVYTGLSCDIVGICAHNHASWSDQGLFILFLSLRETIKRTDIGSGLDECENFVLVSLWWEDVSGINR